MQGNKKQELFVFLVIIGIASFFRFYQLDTFLPGLETHAWLSKTLSAIIGVLTVIGIYSLTKELFEWRFAAITSFLTAISFWHVNFSRLGSHDILLPFFIVFIFYFLWKGVKNAHLPSFFLAGIFNGLGFYAHPSHWFVQLIIVALFVNYWWYLKKDFDYSKYEHSKTKLLQGFSLFMIATILTALPIGVFLWTNPDFFFSQVGNSGLSVFSQNQPFQKLAQNIFKTLGMFNFSGDINPIYNIPGSPLLPWPIGIFFAVGFINELVHWLKRKHGHFSTVHTLIFAWFLSF